MKYNIIEKNLAVIFDNCIISIYNLLILFYLVNLSDN